MSLTGTSSTFSLDTLLCTNSCNEWNSTEKLANLIVTLAFQTKRIVTKWIRLHDHGRKVVTKSIISDILTYSSKTKQISDKSCHNYDKVFLSIYFRAFWTKRLAINPIVVGREAAHTPSLFNVFSSISDATIKGGAHLQHKKIETEWNYQNTYSKTSCFSRFDKLNVARYRIFTYTTFHPHLQKHSCQIILQNLPAPIHYTLDW